jgi:hypothetical protein
MYQNAQPKVTPFEARVCPGPFRKTSQACECCSSMTWKIREMGLRLYCSHWERRFKQVPLLARASKRSPISNRTSCSVISQCPTKMDTV